MDYLFVGLTDVTVHIFDGEIILYIDIDMIYIMLFASILSALFILHIMNLSKTCTIAVSLAELFNR